jgi:flagellar basal body-associated protein FliL
MKIPKLPLILAGVAAILILAAGYIFVLPMLSGGSHAQAVEDEEMLDEPPAKSSATTKRKRPKAAEPGLVYPLKERVLNLAPENGQLRYARIELALEFENPSKGATPAAKKAEGGGHGAPAGTVAIDPALEPVTARMPMIDDAILRIVGQKSAGAITTTEGREQLKQQIYDAVAELVAKPEITGVYIVRLVVQ